MIKRIHNFEEALTDPTIRIGDIVQLPGRDNLLFRRIKKRNDLGWVAYWERVLEAYPFTCPVCGCEQMARPSLFMETGMMNSGHGSCLDCGTFLHLEIAPENDRMIAENWDVWMETERDEHSDSA